MKRSAIILIALSFVLCLAVAEALARGMRGASAARGGRSSYRSPSMSRPSTPARKPAARPATKPSKPAQRPATKPAKKPTKPAQRPATKPAQKPMKPSQLPAMKPGQRPAQKPSKGDVQDFLKLSKPGKPGQLPGVGKAGPTRSVQRPAHRPARVRPNVQQRKVVANNIRVNAVHRHPRMFTPGWRHGRPVHPWIPPRPPHARPPYHWWRWATWGAVTGWIAATAWNRQSCCDYGEDIYYEGDTVYVNDKKVPAEEYYEEADQLATSPTPPTEPRDDWLPLGVFALSQGETAASDMFVQLAVNKDGVIAGYYFNSATDTTRPIQGSVDTKTQRAAWTFADGKNTDIVMETGIYNLTEDQTEALIHFGKEKTQKWLMVRLEEPKDKQAATAGAGK